MKKEMKCKLSIIVPVYNTEKYLRECVESILSQTFEKFELILVDDGSTDSSGEICDELAEKNERIIVIHQKNKGLSSARNSGINIATGKYIGFIDSDDWIEKDMYEVLIKDIEKYNADVAICGFDERFSTFEPQKESMNSFQKVFSLTSEESIKSMLLNESEGEIKWGGGYAVNRIYKRSSFNDFQFPDKIVYQEDLVFSWRIFSESKKTVCRTSIKYHYRQVKTSKVHRSFEGKYMSCVKANYYIYKKTKEVFPRLEKLALVPYFNNLVWCADEFTLLGKEKEFEYVKGKLKKVFLKGIFCRSITFNKKKQALFVLLPYHLSKRIFAWRKKKNDWRKRDEDKNYFD